MANALDVSRIAGGVREAGSGAQRGSRSRIAIGGGAAGKAAHDSDF
jgi:hypothetical protein